MQYFDNFFLQACLFEWICFEVEGLIFFFLDWEVYWNLGFFWQGLKICVGFYSWWLFVCLFLKRWFKSLTKFKFICKSTINIAAELVLFVEK